MKLHAGQPLYSATDLLNFLGCTHSTVLDIEILGDGSGRPDDTDDPYLAILKAKGNDHERRYLEQLRAEGRSIVEIDKEKTSLEEKVELTRKAMRDGIDVVYQGALAVPGWHGYSDFLLRLEEPSSFGAWSYEVADTKLARTAKPKHVVQLCIYSDIIALEQGRSPDFAHVMLGDNSQVRLRLQDFRYYCNRARDRFETFVATPERVSAAERCPHCDLCHWSSACSEEWERTGNLRLVAGLSSAQARKLRGAGISAIDTLAALEAAQTIERIQENTLTRLRTQARLQMQKRTTGENYVELIAPADRRGFARLPRPSDGDLFFDIEGDPVYSSDGSLEYLFGFHYVENGENRYTAFWAHDRSEEKKAFEDALDFIVDRLDRYPSAYIYHYASYEQTVLRRLAREYGSSSRHEDALKQLSQRYGTRENQVDDLLRDRKLVDLYKVVREAIITSQPAYSLKSLEVFFAGQREQEIKSGGDSVVAFEAWLQSRDDRLLQQIADYNEFDCVSTRLCRDWLLTHRPPETKWFDPRTESVEEAEKEAERESKRRDADREILALRDRLVSEAPDEDREWRELLGFILEYHRREARSEWWHYFKRFEPDHDPVADANSIGLAQPDPSCPPRQEKRSRVWRLRFPEQDFKLGVGDSPYRLDTGKIAGEIVAMDATECWIELKVGPTRDGFADEPVSLVAAGPRDDSVIRAAVRRFAEAVVDGSDSDYAAVASILKAEKPRLAGGALLAPGFDQLRGTIDAIVRMQSTHLVIQGPPGSGKTFTSAHAIVSLLDAGMKVGVTSLSHKAINNLMRQVEDVAEKRRVEVRGIKRSNDDDDRLNGRYTVDSKDNKDVLSGGYNLIGGTAWLFARPEMDRQLDYLFIDEAGQVCLANVIASGLSAKNVVLVGDQMQLSQPNKGQHPGDSGLSALEYLMGDHATVPPDRGIFLERTWRMHPGLCRFVSNAFYEGRLLPDDCTAGQLLDLDSDCDGSLAPTGLRFVAVEHTENAQKSIEEAMQLERAYRSLLGRPWTDQRGEINAISEADILVVSPYNLQVNLLKRRLGEKARVGTVDKFQGQEAAVVLVSMASSTAEDAPRGIDFLFSRNRLNVALSRARCLSVIFCSPALLDVVCADLEGMKLVNTVCWAKDYATSND